MISSMPGGEGQPAGGPATTDVVAGLRQVLAGSVDVSPKGHLVPANRAAAVDDEPHLPWSEDGSPVAEGGSLDPDHELDLTSSESRLSVNMRAVGERAKRVADLVRAGASRAFWLVVMFGLEHSAPAANEGVLTPGDVAAHVALLPAPQALTPATHQTPQSTHVDISARMDSFRQHVAEVRAARASGEGRGDGLSESMRLAVVAARAMYDEADRSVKAALTTRWGDLNSERLAATTSCEWAGVDRISEQICHEGLSLADINLQASQAAYYRASTKFSRDVLARAGIKPITSVGF